MSVWTAVPWLESGKEQLLPVDQKKNNVSDGRWGYLSVLSQEGLQ